MNSIWHDEFWDKVRGLPGAVVLFIGICAVWFATSAVGGDAAAMLFVLFTFGIAPVVCIAHLIATLGGLRRRRGWPARLLDVSALGISIGYLYLVLSGQVADLVRASGLQFRQ